MYALRFHQRPLSTLIIAFSLSGTACVSVDNQTISEEDLLREVQELNQPSGADGTTTPSLQAPARTPSAKAVVYFVRDSTLPVLQTPAADGIVVDTLEAGRPVVVRSLVGEWAGLGKNRYTRLSGLTRKPVATRKEESAWSAGTPPPARIPRAEPRVRRIRPASSPSPSPATAAKADEGEWETEVKSILSKWIEDKEASGQDEDPAGGE